MSRYDRIMQQQNGSLSADFLALASICDSAIVPRPDLTEDTELWSVVLTSAKELFPEKLIVFGTLHGLRCAGAKLVENDTATGLKLLPGEISAAEWDVDRRKYLAPIKPEIMELFAYSSIGILRNRLAEPKPDFGEAITGEQERLFRPGASA